jgi:hypothetical protein
VLQSLVSSYEHGLSMRSHGEQKSRAARERQRLALHYSGWVKNLCLLMLVSSLRCCLRLSLG